MRCARVENILMSKQFGGGTDRTQFTRIDVYSIA